MDKLLLDAYRWNRQQHTGWPADKAIVTARLDVEKGTKRYPRTVPYKPGNRVSAVYYSDDWPNGMRLPDRADVVARVNGCYRTIDHEGWFTDDDGDSGTIAGYVLRLTHGRMVAATQHSEWNGVTIYLGEIFTDEMECAIRADRHAEIAAEIERDYQRAWQAGRDAAEKDQEQKEIRKKILKICKQAKSLPPFASAVFRETIIAQVSQLLEEIRDLRIGRDRLQENYGTEEAFKNGYAG